MGKGFLSICLWSSLAFCLGETVWVSASTLKSAAPKAHTSFSKNEPLWVGYARRLSGESDAVRQESLRALAKTPGIEDILTHALGTPFRYLSLDAISALSLKKLLPTLAKLAKADSSGAVSLAMNTLIDSGNVREVQNFYASFLQEEDLSPTLHMIAVDTLSRLQFPFARSALWQWLKPRSPPEVQHSVLSHLRRAVLLARLQTSGLGQAKMALDLLDQFFDRAEDSQNFSGDLLLQALFFYRELNASERTQIKAHLGVCRPSLGHLPFALMNTCAHLSRSLVQSKEQP